MQTCAVADVVGILQRTGGSARYADLAALTPVRQIRRDCRRYVELAIRGWLLLRYSWEDVILDDAWVGTSLAAAVRRGTSGPARLAA